MNNGRMQRIMVVGKNSIDVHLRLAQARRSKPHRMIGCGELRAPGLSPLRQGTFCPALPRMAHLEPYLSGKTP
jgi:hypothetical protein